ncbi:MAG: decaprenyl-phosphate phosphoribosyltransferase [Acidobacteria bacterium]|nr:MAG: decaprenyl-phosphate phosphoribosyltransferase [Acidobacteriota bacterium]PYR61603.1 MAG: decaprenyl-phosphate phosphoribosyltransferase [Acidobacteriota bacterium]
MARSTSSPGIAAAASEPAPQVREVRRRSLLLNLLISLRPGQWTKNLLVFAGLLFGLQLLNSAAVARAMAAFVTFCALSGVVYLINDVLDRESDRQHPHKTNRPIASGALPVAAAIWTAGVLTVAALTTAVFLGGRFTAVAIAYLTLLALYSGFLKHIVIIDVLTIAMGFVLRAVAGAVAVNVEISRWLLVCTILLALFVALAKRRHELVLLADGATSHRKSLGEYSPYLLDQMISVVTASTLVAYVFYTINPETEQKFATQWLGLTIPFPLYGIFRYLYLVHSREGGGSPADLLITDRPLLLCVALWGISVVLIIYKPF